MTMDKPDLRQTEARAVADIAAERGQPFKVGGREYVIVPRGCDVKDLTPYPDLPPRARENITVVERASFEKYLKRFFEKSTVIFADIDANAIKAVIDYHDHNMAENPSAAAGDHLVTLQLRHSEEFERWDEMAGEMHRQEEFALFLEENHMDVLHPDGADLLELARDLEASIGGEFKSSVRLDNGDRVLQYSQETTTNGRIPVPKEIVLNIPVYQGEEEIQLKAKFRHNINGGMLKLGFIWHRVEYIKNAEFERIANDASEAAGLPVFFGKRFPTKSNS